MPSPRRIETCRRCGRRWETRSPTARTCSPKCRAQLRELEHGPTKGAPVREYPPEVVDLICSMYRSGMTVAEIRRAAPKGYRVQTILERYLPARRSTARRDQRGERNHMWSTSPGYQARHLRLGRAADRNCVDCGNPAVDWSYTHDCPDERRDGNHPSPYCLHDEHYVPRCRRCHRRYDFQEVMPYV